VTEGVYERLKDEFQFDCRGVIEMKGKGSAVTYLLTGHLRDKAVAENKGHVAAAT